MATLRELLIEIGVDADDSGIKKMEKGLNQVIGVAKAAGIALIGASAAVFGLAKSAANFADKIEDTAMAIGITNHELQTLAHAAKLSGMNFQEAADGMKFLSRNMVEAAKGTGMQAEAFAKLGVRTTDASGKLRDSNAVLAEIADQFAAMPNGAEKTALAIEIFGRSGARMIPMLNAGSAGLAEMRAEAERLGIVLDDDAIRAGSDFNDALDRLSAVFVGLKNSIGVAVIPALMEMVNTLRELVVANIDVIKSGITQFMQGLIKIIQYATTFISFLVNAFMRFSSVLGGVVPLLKTTGILLLAFAVGRVVQGVYNLATGFLRVAMSLKLVNAAAMLLPLLIGAAIVGAALIIDDFIAWTQGRPSVLGFLIKNKDEILEKIKEAIVKAGRWLDDMFYKIFNLVETGIVKVFEFFGVMPSEAQSAASAIMGVFTWLYEGIKHNAQVTFARFISLAKNLANDLKPVVQGLVEIINEPLLFFTRFPSMLRNIFNAAFNGLSSLFVDITTDLLRVFKVPEERIAVMVEALRAGLGEVKNLVGNVFEAVGSIFTNSLMMIKSMLDVVFEGAAGVINFASRFFGRGNTADDMATQTRSELGNSIGQSAVDNRAVSNSTNVSPTINVSVTSTGAADGDDIARKVRDEIASVARNLSASNTPQFAN